MTTAARAVGTNKIKRANTTVRISSFHKPLTVSSASFSARSIPQSKPRASPLQTGRRFSWGRCIGRWGRVVSWSICDSHSGHSTDELQSTSVCFLYIPIVEHQLLSQHHFRSCCLCLRSRPSGTPPTIDVVEVGPDLSVVPKGSPVRYISDATLEQKLWFMASG